MNTQDLIEKQPIAVTTFTITVNSKPVKVHNHRMTGLEIKSAAIEAGLNVKLDFLLFHVREHQPQKRVADDETISITKKDEFDCIGNDDNSNGDGHA